MIFLEYAVYISLFIIGASMFLSVYRLLRGPDFEDRVVALDLISSCTIGFIAVYSIKSGLKIYIDVGIIIGLISFIATIAFAYFLERRTNDG
ncbi:MAG: cation:proton antiporter [Candidatus Kapaibacterium sp.]|jgi:multicomponent Na+:H+ antiporter subunit F|nr:cation:proton antiporter [Candidatus Kapabacteria bacterium]